LKKYLKLTSMGIMDHLHFRLAVFISLLINMLYLLFVYFLWRAIFDSTASGMINGMNFEQTMIYMVFAAALMNFTDMYIVWNMARDIQSGKIVVELLKPMNYRRFKFFDGIGMVISRFFIIFLPTSVMVYFASGRSIHLGWNIPLFLLSMMMGIMVKYYINFATGVICMYTESVWGVDMCKQVLVGLFSGVVVPIAFFPDWLKGIALNLPFQAICNSPLELLLHPEYEPMHIATILAMQLFWVVFLGFATEGFFRIALRQITVNGG